MTSEIQSLLDLEPAICDLDIVADLSRHIIQSLLERPTLEDERGMHFTFSKAEHDRAFFLASDVQDRAAKLKDQFYRAAIVGTCPAVDKSNNGDNSP